MGVKIQFSTDTVDESLPKGYMRNASGQVVRVDFCCRNFADGYDCACSEM